MRDAIKFYEPHEYTFIAGKIDKQRSHEAYEGYEG
jgi:hypothetical protein